MANINTEETLELLAAEIGETVYMDIAKWHLYLGDAKLHTGLAAQFYPLLVNDSLSASKVADILQATSIKLGGGRREISLLDLIPTQCQSTLIRVLEEFQDKL